MTAIDLSPYAVQACTRHRATYEDDATEQDRSSKPCMLHTAILFAADQEYAK